MQTFRPLKGIRVLDFSRLIPGPFCTKILSDLGAEVVKIEDKNRPDDIEKFAPVSRDGISVLGLYLNKNKKRLAIDFKAPKGRQILKKLILKSDVLVESFRPGVMGRLGLAAGAVHKINPRIVYASITGYGQRSLHSRKAGHDLNFMAASSFLNHVPGGVPGYQFADFVGGGLFAALMIQAALMEPGKKRKRVDISMTDVLVYLKGHHLFSGKPVDLGPIEGRWARYQVYRTRDKKWVVLGALEDKFWHRFCDVIERPRFKKQGCGGPGDRRVREALKRVFAERTARFWKALGKKHDICLTVVSDKKDLVRDGYLKKGPIRLNDATKEFYQPRLLSSRSGRPGLRKFGADNRPVLKELGYSAREIDALAREGII